MPASWTANPAGLPYPWLDMPESAAIETEPWTHELPLIPRGVLFEVDAAYIALMHPPVALALADWLDEQARGEEYRLAEFGHRVVPDQGYALARAILRESP